MNRPDLRQTVLGWIVALCLLASSAAFAQTPPPPPDVDPGTPPDITPDPLPGETPNSPAFVEGPTFAIFNEDDLVLEFMPDATFTYTLQRFENGVWVSTNRTVGPGTSGIGNFQVSLQAGGLDLYRIHAFKPDP